MFYRASSRALKRLIYMRGFSFKVLLAAAAYNIMWGAMVIAFPNLSFDLAELPRPNYPELWQCVGMIVGVYGVAYAAAAFDPVRFWPIILVGLLGKILGPLGFIRAINEETFNWIFGINIIFNDLIWWVPFIVILKWTGSELQKTPYDESEEIDLQEELNNHYYQGTSLFDLSFKEPLILDFVRHTGCTFCRKQLKERGDDGILVHMSKQLDISSVSDPKQKLYRACNIGRGSWGQTFGPNVLWPTLRACILEGHLPGILEGDGFQLAGRAIIKEGKLISSITAKDVTVTSFDTHTA